MASRTFLPPVLLLALVATPVTHGEVPAGRANPSTRSLGAHDAAGGAARGAELAQVERLQPSAEGQDVSPETLRRVSDYLRCRSANGRPSPEARAAWDGFYASCDASIRRFAATFCDRPVEVEDCTQEVWASLLRALPDFQLDGSRGRFTSWLYAVVRSKASDMRRSRARRPCAALSPAVASNVPAEDGDPAVILQRRQDRDLVHDALADLRTQVSERSYEVLRLRHVEGRSVSEVAGALGLTPEQVWAREHRAKRKLANLLRERIA